MMKHWKRKTPKKFEKAIEKQESYLLKKLEQIAAKSPAQEDFEKELQEAWQR
jgi:hypothetical protein